MKISGQIDLKNSSFSFSNYKEKPQTRYEMKNRNLEYSQNAFKTRRNSKKDALSNSAFHLSFVKRKSRDFKMS